jgi:hypothetical protein
MFISESVTVTGEKLLLRRAARSIGLTASAVLAKRAIQFGSRVARIENHKEKGNDKLGDGQPATSAAKEPQDMVKQ